MTTKYAKTLLFAVIVTVHVVLEPTQAPPQLENFQPAEAIAVSLIWVPVATVFTHAVGQLMPLGLLVTLPEPNTFTVSVENSAAGCLSPLRAAAREVRLPPREARGSESLIRGVEDALARERAGQLAVDPHGDRRSCKRALLTRELHLRRRRDELIASRLTAKKSPTMLPGLASASNIPAGSDFFGIVDDHAGPCRP